MKGEDLNGSTPVVKCCGLEGYFPQPALNMKTVTFFLLLDMACGRQLRVGTQKKKK